MADGFVLNAFMAFLVAAAIVFTDFKNKAHAQREDRQNRFCLKLEVKVKRGGTQSGHWSSQAFGQTVHLHISVEGPMWHAARQY